VKLNKKILPEILTRWPGSTSPPSGRHHRCTPAAQAGAEAEVLEMFDVRKRLEHLLV
jgi:hypothetical protein